MLTASELIESYLAGELVHADLDEETAEFFEHYGVPGMKWGKRKARGTSTNPSVKSLSDDELKKAIQRLQMEREFAKLTAPAPSAGKRFINDVLSDSGKKLATKYMVEVGAKFVDKALAQAIAKSAVKAAAKR